MLMSKRVKEKGTFTLKRKTIILVMAIIMLFTVSGCGNKKQEAKAKALADYISTCGERARYGLYDLNSDGSAELLIAEGDSHADSVTVCIYDEKKQSVNESGNFGSFGCMSCISEKGYIISGYTGQGIDETQIYEITANGIDVIASFWDNSGTIEPVHEYRVNDINVSEQEYYDAYMEYSALDRLTAGYSDFFVIKDYESNYKHIIDMLTDIESTDNN